MIISNSSVTMEFNRSLWIEYDLNETTLSYQFMNTEGIDTTKITDSIALIALGEGEKPGIVITKYDSTTTPRQLTRGWGLSRLEETTGKYLNFSLMQSGEDTMVVQVRESHGIIDEMEAIILGLDEEAFKIPDLEKFYKKHYLRNIRRTR